MTENVVVRPMRATDRDAFLAMWADFVAFAPGEPGNHEMGDVNWSRIADKAHALHGLVAVDQSDMPLGFTLYLSFPFTWSRGDVCYLQDIYVRSEARGRGVARTMIERLAALGAEAGWFKIFWMTQGDNMIAQHLYDKVAERKDYIRYDLVVGDA